MALGAFRKPRPARRSKLGRPGRRELVRNTSNCWAVVTEHPNRQPRHLLVRGWYASANEADAASLDLVAALNENFVVPPCLCGLAIVEEREIVRIGPEDDHYSWRRKPEAWEEAWVSA